MLSLENPLLWLGGLLVLGLGLLLWRGPFSAETRERRRRERSHRQVVSRKRGPTVKLAARVDKPKRDR